MAPLIIIEGLLGSGKTTLSKRLSRVNGWFRVGEHLAQNFKEILLEDISYPNMQFFLESDKRKFQLARNMQRRGIVSVMDRGVVSTLAHSYSVWQMTGDKTMYDYEKLWINREGLLQTPTAYIFLALTPEESQERKGRRGNSDGIKRYIENLYYTLDYYDRFFSNEHKDVPVYRINSNKSLLEVMETAQQIIKKIISNKQNGN